MTESKDLDARRAKQREAQRRYRTNPKNRDKLRAHSAAFRAKHRQELAAKARARYAVDPEPKRAATAVWRAENPEKVQACRVAWRKSDSCKAYRLRIRGSLKERARKALNNAIQAGKLKREPCEVCGNARSEGHHSDYSKPLDVQWFCRKHHVEHERGPGALGIPRPSLVWCPIAP
jgi:hypothetical protein